MSCSCSSRLVTMAGFMLTAFSAISAAPTQALTPMDLSFKLLWNKRFVFDAVLPLPQGMTFFANAQFSSEVHSLPAEMTLETTDGTILQHFPAPADIKPPYTMHLMGSFALYVTKDGITTFKGFKSRPKNTDIWGPDSMTRFIMRANGGMTQPKTCLTAGAGQADVRFVTRGRQNALYFEDGRLFFTFSQRGSTGCMGVASLDPRNLDVRLEGVILFDHNDGRLRRDIAAHLFYDEEAAEWRAWCSNFGSPGGREPGGINVAWCKQNPLHGIQVMKARNLGLTGMHEDPSGIWDPEARKWRLYLCTFEKGIKGQMLESDSWDGPYTPLTEAVKEDSTGTTIQWMNGTRYCFAGSAEHAIYVFSYPHLKKLGKLKLEPEPWGDTPLHTPWGIMKTNNSRVWGNFIELPDGYPYKYLLLTMDRVNIPGWPTPNWTYGGLYIYGANPPER